MNERRLVRIDPAKSAGVASLLAIIGSILWIPAALAWRSKMLTTELPQAMEAMGPMWVPPAWLIYLSPITNGGIVLVTTFVTVWIINLILKRIGGIPFSVVD